MTIAFGILFFLASVMCFHSAHRDAMISRPCVMAYIERDGGRAYFMEDNIKDLWKFVQKDDNVKISSGSVMKLTTPSIGRGSDGYGKSSHSYYHWRDY